jgi:hypothetical protein
MNSQVWSAGEWAIDASGGAAGNPIMVQPVQAFYERLKLTNVHDIKLEKVDADPRQT